MISATDQVTVHLEADEANAIVYALAWAVTTTSGGMEQMPVDSPGDLHRISERCARISRLAAVNDQLLWRKHFGRIGGEPPALTASKSVLLEIATELHSNAEEARDHPETESHNGGPFDFERAARTLTLAFAGPERDLVGAGDQR